MLGDEENQAKLADAIKKLPDTLDNMNRTFRATEETLRTFTERSKTDGRTPIERMVDTIEMTERTLRKFSESNDPSKPPPADQIVFSACRNRRTSGDACTTSAGAESADVPDVITSVW